MAEQEELGVIEFEQNLSEVEKPPLIAAGKYTGEVQDVQVQVSAGKGNRYYAIKVVIPADEIAADIREHYEEGVALYWNRQLVPDGKDRRSLFNLRKMIEAFGLNSNTTSVDPNEWMGCKVRLNVGHSQYNGEDRAEIKSLEPASAKAAAPAAGRGKKR